MYLKRLEIRGFKSFPDKTEIDFNSGVTCIVGPNGSGKSNLTDAVRWVLGEQKVKTLRGSRMEDIIFSGTKHRKAQGTAEVSLIFDNVDRILPVDYIEVKVTRKITRSGDNDYFINDTPCRLKDIRNIFTDTGIGVDGYSIIGQGRIDSILSNRSDDRRLVFEEAAGIVKFRNRKRDAERKLESAVQNLERVDDILRELGQRIGPLEEQSKKASQYLVLAGELKGLEVNQMIRDIEGAMGKVQEILVRCEETRKNRDQAEGMLLQSEAELEVLRATIQSDQEQSKELNQAHYQALSKCQDIEARMANLQEANQGAEQEKIRLTAEAEGFQNKIVELEALCQALEAEAEEISQELYQVDNRVQIIEGQLNTHRTTQQAQREEQDTLRDDLIRNMNGLERKKSDIGSLQHFKETLLKQVEQINQERILETAKEQNRTLDYDTIQEMLEEIRTYLESISKRRTEFEGQLSECKMQLSQMHIQKDHVNRHFAELGAEQRLLQELEASYDGYGESVRGVLKACNKQPDLGRGVHGVVADILKIPERYETAVDVILGRTLQNIVVDNEAVARRLIKFMKSRHLGRATFLPMADLRNSDEQGKQIEKVSEMDGFIGRGSDLVQCDKKYESLLGYLLDRVIIVDTIENAGAMMKMPWLRFRIVTLEGDVFVPGGAITGGSVKVQKTGLLGRKRRIAEIGELLESDQTTLNELLGKISLSEKQKDKLEQDVLDLNRTIDDKRLELARKEEQWRQIEVDLENSQKSLTRLDMEKIRLKTEQEQADLRLTTLKREIGEHEETIQTLEARMSALTVEIESGHSDLNDIQEKLTQARVLRAAQNEKTEALKTRLTVERQRLQESIHENEQRIKRCKSLSEMVEGRTEQSEIFQTELTQTKALAAELLNQMDGHETEAANRREQMEQLLHTVAEGKGQIQILTDRLQQGEQEHHRLENQQSNLISALWDKYELSWLEALEMKTEWEEAASQKRIKELKREIRDLGDVHIGSIQEYQEVRERHDFLFTQKEDLVEAQQSLQKIIRDLDRSMRQQFRETFDIVREHFTGIFSELFGGGSADVVLSDPENPLECDIFIHVQPPGKRVQSMELMSGGERALTAIALLFAILKSKPSPFCMLDEIEAALDDVNVWRFADFLKHFIHRSQFLIITHRKGTMEIADTLYGVTMEEHGVSRVLSVKMEDVPV